MKRRLKGIFAVMSIVMLLLVSGCGNTIDNKIKIDGWNVSAANPIYLDKEAGTVQVFAVVNGKYLDQPTRHGLNGQDGKYGDQAVFTTTGNPLDFYDNILELGATPAVAKGGDASQEFETIDGRQYIKGSEIKVTVTWEGADREYDINEVMIDSTGKEINYKFGGNYDAASANFTGCFMCFDSCMVGIISNANQPTNTFDNGEAEFMGNKDVLPQDGTPLIVTYSLK